jgi:hypothetical protein
MSGRGRNPSRPNNSGFKVIPAHAPRSAYLGKGERASCIIIYRLIRLTDNVHLPLHPESAKKLKESLIERAKIKKSFAKTLKKEGLSSDRLVRGADGTIIGGQRPSADRGGVSAGRGGRGRGRGGSSLGAVGSGRGGRGGARSGPSHDGARELARQAVGTSKSKSTPPTTTTPKQPAPESESDESELESGEERAPRPPKPTSARDVDAEVDSDDDGFFDDDNGENTIDSRLSLNKGKGRARVGHDDEDDEDTGPRESRERSRAGPAPGSDMDDEDTPFPSASPRLPYTRPTSAARGGRGGTSSRGRPSTRGTFGASAASSTVHNPGTARPWGPNPDAGTTTRPKGKKDASNPNFTFLGGAGDDDPSEQAQGSRFPSGGRRERPVPNAAPAPTLPPPSDMPFRGKPLHSHKISPASTLPSDPTITLRDLKRSAYLGSGVRTGAADVHPGRTKRVMANAGKRSVADAASTTSGARTTATTTTKPNDKRTPTTSISKPFTRGQLDRTQKPKPNSYLNPSANTSYRNSAANTGRRQPRLGARMGALLQEIERRGV